MRKSFGAVAALALLSAQAAPATAMGTHSATGRQSGAFVGAYLKLPFSSEHTVSSTARAGFKLSVVHQYRDARAPYGGARVEGEALDLGVGADGRTSLRLAGRSLAGSAVRLGYEDADEGGFDWWIPVAVIGGAAVIGGIVFLAQVAEGNRNSE